MAKKTLDPECVHLDTILSQIGTFGRYQVLTFLLLVVPTIFEAVYSTQYIFTAEEVDYRCKIQECDSLQPSYNEAWVPHALPNNRTKQCYRYPSSSLTANTTNCRPDDFNSSVLVHCSEWIYEEKNTLVSELQLACQEWKRTSVGMAHSVGSLVSLLYTGHLSDRFGRKVMIWSTGTLVGIIGLIKSFSINYLMFISAEFLEAVAHGGLYTTAFVYGIEFCSKENRILFTCSLAVIYAIGGALYAIVAWQLPYWRNHIRAIYTPALLMCFYVLLLDESMRWLLSKGRKDETVKIIHKIANVNKINISKETVANLTYEDNADTKASPLLETLRSKVILLRFAICCFWWVTSILVYYGLTIGSVSLGGDKYWNYALSSLMDIPGSIACMLLLDKFGRKKCLLVSFASGGLFCVAMVFVPQSMVWLTTTLFLLGKVIVSFTVAALYFYTSELFPTYTRNSMHAACSCVGRVGAILAPQMPLLSAISPIIPPAVYASCSLVAATLTLLTPDTRRTILPDTVLQAERIDKRTLSETA